MTEAYVWLQTKLFSLQQAVEKRAKDDQGAGTVEYVGIVCAVAAALAIVVNTMNGRGAEIGDLVVDKVLAFINKFA
jgi:Flp pilus assembly pilin Flp